MPKEKCFIHPETDAFMWRNKMDPKEPDRVPLCASCIKEIRDAWPPRRIKFFPLEQKRVKRVQFQEDFEEDE